MSTNQHQVLTRQDIFNSYMVAEFVTLARDGSPVCWPLAPYLERERLVFSTGYMFPTKARNAQRNPRVAALFSDPTASGRTNDDPLVLVQGMAEVFDQDIQRNTERYIDLTLRKASLAMNLIVRIPGVMKSMAGYLARIFIKVIPEREYVWARGSKLPDPLRKASRPVSFSPKAGIEFPQDVNQWVTRYARPPILSYIDESGWPAISRIQAKLQGDRIAITSDIEACDGAPACLTFHQLIGNYQANDAFIIRGHFNATGWMIPESVVGFNGTSDDRGVGSLKAMRQMMDWGKRLPAELAKEGRPMIVPRLPSKH
jgi:hypothetical protein